MVDDDEDDNLLSLSSSYVGLVLAQTSEKSSCRVSLAGSAVAGSRSTSVFLDVLVGEAISRRGNVWSSPRARSRCVERTGDMFDVIEWRRARSSSGSSMSRQSVQVMEREEDGGIWIACKRNAMLAETFVSSTRCRCGRRNAS